MALAEEWEYSWLTQDRGMFMKKLNTHAIYLLGQRMRGLIVSEHKEGMTINDIFLKLFQARLALKGQVTEEFFSPSLKRSASAVLQAIYDLGWPDSDSVRVETETPIAEWQLNWLKHKARDFEIVLANELPGLATYVVSPKGIFSTDDLITNAELQIPEKHRSALSAKAIEDIRQAGKCLAFELSTASAFHMWRAVESMMDNYHEALTGKSFADSGITRNWGKYIPALEEANAEKKITVFLDHIRQEYRNPISHPDVTLELDEAFGLFAPAISVIGQMLREILEIQRKKTIVPVRPAKAAKAP